MGIIKEILSGLTKITKQVIKSTNIKNDLSDSIDMNIRVLSGLGAKDIKNRDFIAGINLLDFSEINDYVSFTPLYKKWICDKKSIKADFGVNAIPRLENRTLEEILRSSKKMLNDLQNHATLPVKDKSARISNLKNNLIIAKKVLGRA